MSIKQYPGGIITKNPTAPTGPYQDGAASGIWTLDQAMNYTKQGIWPIAGNTNPSAFIENLFSTYLYTGAGGSESVPNGINLTDNGGMIWIKSRSNATDHVVFDTVRGLGKYIQPNLTSAQVAFPTAGGPQFGTNGFSFTSSYSDALWNGSGYTYASWTFRKQPKFFDIVTYTGTGSAKTIAHNLGSVPGCIIVKSTSQSDNWKVYHSGLTSNAYYILLDSTAAQSNAVDLWNNTTPTSTVFSIGSSSNINTNGATYVAYLFASNAGGFGLTGTDNVITCGSFTMPSSGDATITLGYEPQWVMAKTSSTTGGWFMADVMRGWSNTSDAYVYANTSGAEVTNTPNYWNPTATGFLAKSGCFPANSTVIYIAIRRGPMKVPTDATKVFSPVLGTSTAPSFVTNFPVDLNLATFYTYGSDRYVGSRLQGSGVYLKTNSTDAELSSASIKFDYQNGCNTSDFNAAIGWNFQRAPSFFDEVCYTGNNGSNLTVAHNLGVVPELVILKKRSSASNSNWGVSFNFTSTNQNNGFLNTTAASTNDTYANIGWMTQQPTSTNLYLAVSSNFNYNTETFVGYLFATCAGVSKVGSYTGTGTLTTINCGFTGGARFVLIKRTDSTSNWFLWDTTRGMISGADNMLPLNTITAQANANSVYTATTGFQLLASPSADVNTSGGTYIYLAIA